MRHPNAAAEICRPIVDSVKVWESIAAAEYALDGVLDGWDSDSELEMPPESAEDKYLQVRLHLHHSVSAWLLTHPRVCEVQSEDLKRPDGTAMYAQSQQSAPVYSCKFSWNSALVVQAHPNVPVVDNLEDIWLVNKLQQERKAKQTRQNAV